MHTHLRSRGKLSYPCHEAHGFDGHCVAGNRPWHRAASVRQNNGLNAIKKREPIGSRFYLIHHRDYMFAIIAPSMPLTIRSAASNHCMWRSSTYGLIS
ncbi:hypothetical protein KP13_31967 [Klebsiella pneumoniae subsp. pneumoniae Kp13]|nr:hypothetical protein KP13_31967 [Klebsiella pneumoniae subsp. pneumoniae Kp13]